MLILLSGLWSLKKVRQWSSVCLTKPVALYEISIYQETLANKIRLNQKRARIFVSSILFEKRVRLYTVWKKRRQHSTTNYFMQWFSCISLCVTASWLDTCARNNSNIWGFKNSTHARRLWYRADTLKKYFAFLTWNSLELKVTFSKSHTFCSSILSTHSFHFLGRSSVGLWLFKMALKYFV